MSKSNKIPKWQYVFKNDKDVRQAIFKMISDKAPTNKIYRCASSEQRRGPRTRSCHESEHLV